MATRLSHSTAHRGERVGVTRRDGTRVAGAILGWGSSELRVRRVVTGEYVVIPGTDVDSVISFDR
jgi:hypothetical protein